MATAIAEDVSVFAQMMRRLAFRTRTPKALSAVAAERIGRLKLNGRIIRRSPLSRFEELERAQLEPFHAQAAREALRQG